MLGPGCSPVVHVSIFKSQQVANPPHFSISVTKGHQKGLLSPCPDISYVPDRSDGPAGSCHDSCCWGFLGHQPAVHFLLYNGSISAFLQRELVHLQGQLSGSCTFQLLGLAAGHDPLRLPSGSSDQSSKKTRKRAQEMVVQSATQPALER